MKQITEGAMKVPHPVPRPVQKLPGMSVEQAMLPLLLLLMAIKAKNPQPYSTFAQLLDSSPTAGWSHLDL